MDDLTKTHLADHVASNNSSNTVTSGWPLGQPRPQPWGTSQVSNQTEQQPSGFSFGRPSANNVTSSGCFGGVAPTNVCGNTSHNPPSTNGGLFSTKKAQSSSPGGIFGDSRPENTTESLFGSNNGSQPRSSEGLFGSSRPNFATGGLFRSTQQQSLFGQSRPDSNTSSIFGNTNQTQPQNSRSLFGNPRPNTTTGGLFGNSQPQSSGGLFGTSSNNTTISCGNCGCKVATPGTTNSLFGNNTNSNARGGLFGNNNNQSQPQNSGGLFGGNSTNCYNRNAPNGEGLFGQNQGQNRTFGNGFGCNSSTSIFDRSKPSTTFGSNPFGGSGVNTAFGVNTCQTAPAQGFSNTSPFANVGRQSNVSCIDDDYGNHKIGSTYAPYRQFVEKQADGIINVYNHISFTDPYHTLSNEELRLNDYNNGAKFGDPRLHYASTQIQTGQLPGIFDKPIMPLYRPVPTTEVEQVLRQIASQKVEIEALRARLEENESSNVYKDGAKYYEEQTKLLALSRIDEEAAKRTAAAAAAEQKQKVDEMATLMCIFERKLSIIEKEMDTLKKNPKARELVVTNDLSGKHKEFDDEKEGSATSTPVNIFTPTSSAAESPAPPFDPTITSADTNDWVDTDSFPESETQGTTIRTTNNITSSCITYPNYNLPTTNTNPDLAGGQIPDISSAARQILTYLENSYPSISAQFALFTPDMHANVGLEEIEYQHAAVELVVKRFLMFGKDGRCFRRDWN